MTDLSPATAAVLAAYRSSHLSINNLAAALRAAADQLAPYSVEDMPGAAFCRNKILDIAAELENL